MPRGGGIATTAVGNCRSVAARVCGSAAKGVAKWINMRPELVAGVSGHSVRVGATQDLLSFNMDLPSVIQAGRWKSNRMPMRYGEHLLAARGAMARVAEL